MVLKILQSIRIDDIIIWDNSKSDHDKTLNKVLNISKNYNIKFNLKKFKLGATDADVAGVAL
jgi:putative aminopeptidase FrvX